MQKNAFGTHPRPFCRTGYQKCTLCVASSRSVAALPMKGNSPFVLQNQETE